MRKITITVDNGIFDRDTTYVGVLDARAAATRALALGHGVTATEGNRPLALEHLLATR